MKRKKFPIIKLAPWEHLPCAAPQEIEAAAQNVVPFEWKGQALQVAARFADVGDGSRYMFVRFIGEEDEGNWVLGYNSVENFPRQYGTGQRLKLTKQMSHLQKSYFFPFGRMFYLDADQLGTLSSAQAFIATNGRGCWVPPQHDRVDANSWLLSPFELPLHQGKSLRHVEASKIRERLLAELKEPSSDAGFALRWRNLSEAERENQLLKVERGSVDEFRHLLTCVLLIEPTVQTQNGHWLWFMEGDNSGLACSNDGQNFSDWVDLPMRLRVWEHIAFDYFAPTPQDSLLRRHACTRRWFNQRLSFLHVEAQTPTQHERLEAALFLRDWARDKVAPRKLQLLLSKV